MPELLRQLPLHNDMSDRPGQATSAAPSLRSRASTQQGPCSSHEPDANSIQASPQAIVPFQERVLAQSPQLGQAQVIQAQDTTPAEATALTSGDPTTIPASIRPKAPPRDGDYLQRVRGIMTPEEFKRLFSDHFTIDAQGKSVMTAVVDGVKSPAPFTLDNLWNNEYAVSFKNRIEPPLGSVPTASGVLVVEDINTPVMQALGNAFDIDPSIFARHLGPFDAWKNGSAALDHLSNLFSLSSRQASGKAAAIASSAREGNFNFFECGISQVFRTHKGVLKSWSSTDTGSDPYPDIIWGRSGTDRMLLENLMTRLVCRISCVQVSAHGCKPICGFHRSTIVLTRTTIGVILTDPRVYHRKIASNKLFPDESFTLMRSTTTPESRGFMIPSDSDEDLEEYYLFRSFRTLTNLFSTQSFGIPSQGALNGKLATRLLFGVDGDPTFDARSASISLILPVLMYLSVMQSNTDYLQRRLLALCHQAISDPNLTTFQPLVLLRRKIADTQDRLRESQSRLGLAHEYAYQALRDNLSDRAAYSETLAAYFDPMIEQLTLISRYLDQEVNFVIGSVTVLVRGIVFSLVIHC